MTSTLNPTLLITNLMKRIVSIVPRKLKNTRKKANNLPNNTTRERRYVLKYWVILC